jgi:hypothetical protein
MSIPDRLYIVALDPYCKQSQFSSSITREVLCISIVHTEATAGVVYSSYSLSLLVVYWHHCYSFRYVSSPENHRISLEDDHNRSANHSSMQTETPSVRHLALGTNKVWRTNHSLIDTHAAELHSKNRHHIPKVCFLYHFSLVDHLSLPTGVFHSYCHHHRDFPVIIPRAFHYYHLPISRLTHFAISHHN